MLYIYTYFISYKYLHAQSINVYMPCHARNSVICQMLFIFPAIRLDHSRATFFSLCIVFFSLSLFQFNSILTRSIINVYMPCVLQHIHIKDHVLFICFEFRFEFYKLLYILVCYSRYWAIADCTWTNCKRRTQQRSSEGEEKKN